MNQIIKKHYFLSIIVSTISQLVFGIISMPKDCHECALLLIVGSLICLIAISIFNLPVFILYKIKKLQTQKLILPVVTVFNSIFLLILIITMFYNLSDNYVQTDLYFWLSAAIPNCIINLLTLYRGNLQLHSELTNDY